jgi:hypothetical protein
MDETALPILLGDLAAEQGALTPAERQATGRCLSAPPAFSSERTGEPRTGKKILDTRRSRWRRRSRRSWRPLISRVCGEGPWRRIP